MAETNPRHEFWEVAGCAVELLTRIGLAGLAIYVAWTAELFSLEQLMAVSLLVFLWQTE